MKNRFFKRTKIVATIGPAVDSEEKIEKLIKAGVNVFRLNTSHETMEVHDKRFDLIRQVCEKLRVYCSIMIDLQGPKIRVGNLDEPINLKKNDEAVFSHQEDSEKGG